MSHHPLTNTSSLKIAAAYYGALRLTHTASDFVGEFARKCRPLLWGGITLHTLSGMLRPKA